MQSEIAKKHKAVGQRWIHSDKQLTNGEVVNRGKEDKTVSLHFVSFNNNATTNLDEFNTGYIDKPEVNMEKRTVTYFLI